MAEVAGHVIDKCLGRQCELQKVNDGKWIEVGQGE